MNILFLIRSLNTGGAERQLINLSKGLFKLGHKVCVLTFYDDGDFESELDSAGVPLISLGKKHRWDIIRFIISLFKIIKTIKPDILYSFLSTSNLISIFIKIFFPKTRIIWGIRSSNTDMNYYGWLPKMEFYLLRSLSRFADKVIVNSFAGREFAKNIGYDTNSWAVIPNGIDLEMFYPDQNKRNLFRRRLNIQKNEFIVGLIARLDPMKGHRTFIQAAHLLLKQKSDIRFVCVGDGSATYRESLEAYAQSLGIASMIIWTGKMADMISVYNGIDILCLSSAFGEGFPNTIGEAMACGVPCVVTDVGDSARIVEDNGIVVPPENPEMLAKGIQILMEKLPRDLARMRSLAQNRIIENYSVQNMVGRTETILKNIRNSC